MITSFATDATASTATPALQPSPHSETTTATGASLIPPTEPDASRENIRHMLFGSLSAVEITIRRLHKLGYAEVNDWSPAIATGRGNEVMTILTKRMKTE